MEHGQTQPVVLKADVLLLLAAAIWGSGFVAQRLGMEHVGPMTFNAVRFAVGSCVLLPVLFIRRRAKNDDADRCHAATRRRADLLGGVLAGSVLFVGATLQQIGMMSTTAGKGGFITGLYVVFVPILGLTVRIRPSPKTWAGAGFALAGLYLLCATGPFAMSRGDWYIFVSAFFWAAHVLVVGRLAPNAEPLRLAAAQFAVVSVLALIAACLYEEISVDGIVAARWAILYSGVFSVGIAFGLQVVAQRSAPPAHTAVLISMEAVFAAIAGWLILGETLDRRQMTGCALMLLGGLLTQIRRRCRADPAPPTP